MFYINSTFDTTSSLPNFLPELTTELEVVKEMDIEKERIYRVMTDVENYHKILPRNIQSSNIIERSDNVILVEYEVFEAGINTKLLVQHTMYPYNEHIMEIIDGDAKGTKITQKFSDTDSVTKINTLIDVQSNENQTVIFSEKFQNIETEIKQFLKNKMYNNKNVMKKNNNGKKIIKKLFKAIVKKPNKYIKSSDLKNDKHRAISDYISGMTDRFAIQLYKSSQ